MSILDTIKNRTSCRTFKPVPLTPDDKRSLEAFIRENDTGLDNECIPFTIIEKKAGEKPMKLDYGIIRQIRGTLVLKQLTPEGPG